MSNWAPVLLVVGADFEEVGEPLEGTAPWLLCPQPAAPNTATAVSARAAGTRSRELLVRTRLTPHMTDAIDHAQFATAVPDERLAVLVEDRLVGAVDGDVVDDVVGNDGVTRAHHGHGPAGSQRVDGVAGAVDQQRRPVAVDGLLDTHAGDM